MNASDALLHRIEQDPSLAAALAWPGDFDIERRDPVEDVVLPTGISLHPIAGCGAGGTYFLCGDAADAADGRSGVEGGGGARPVLYADSEGQATLIGADLVEAVTLIVVLPFWRDLASGFTPEQAGAEVREDHPEFDAERDALLAALGLAPVSDEVAAERLMAVAARTSPEYLPRVPDDEHMPYDPLFGDGPEG
ncbi:hypothetical protein SAMN05216267_1006209 [Actinacidiphila rubida]|uniref:SUKH-4 immunity protein n=2 Tax=Actinacidiphila rubida TaxID=310780 RepID=A0A1H8HGU0_9ACTN|nr:hypothetical protein SAMN05216267_1006209 [Actinacidiphila rubida]